MHIPYFLIYPTLSQNGYGNKFMTQGFVLKARRINSKSVRIEKKVSADNLNRQQKLFFETRFVNP